MIGPKDMIGPKEWPTVTDRILPWVDELSPRDTATIDTVVIHCTEEPTLEAARSLAEASQERIAGHYYIDRDGYVERWVPDNRVAYHAVRENTRSIGIEIVNEGRYPQHFRSTTQHPLEPYPKQQLDTLRGLLRMLRATMPGLWRLVRHSDVDTRLVPASDDPALLVRRRIDPGPLFPWQSLVFWWDNADNGSKTP
jgi:N-acetylmuramoyl-L-alanine amidase